MPKTKVTSSIPAEGLTVVVPTFNGASWLKDTISNIEVAITYAGVTKCEILVVNDGSTDETSDVVQDIIKKSKYSIRLKIKKWRSFYCTTNWHY